MNTMSRTTVRESLRDAMIEEMDRDYNVIILGEEVGEYNGAYKVTQGLLSKFGPKRVIDTPITEAGFAGLGIGAAFNGLRPIVEFMTFNFAMQAIDQIINSAAKTSYMSGGAINCPIVFRGPNGAASQVAAQHSQCFASWYAHCPGLKVISPYDAQRSKILLKAAIRDNNPVVFLENEILYNRYFDIDPNDTEAEIGKSFIIRKGTDITITGFSIMLEKIIKAADILQENYGINAEIIDLCTLRPLDVETITNSIKKTGFLLSVEEGWPFASIGSEICATIMEYAFDWLDGPPCRLSSKDIPLPYAKTMEERTIPQVEDIVNKACYILNVQQ
ncbi:pyruvate dehydrogenase complex E1 component subunit beta [Candidatus Gromoviella agglomerans]|uniref:pyruvate dehydrogenase complex E1 component subunit beta n=1 Tax=Candidatus Gromoviella agglomerans TaxID=2806609 RepID=UPI001E37DCCA|nr:pyruvate dehydrogenase complex E1 component subunit beta [Candidatus Gromoviella agglomerans]UFX98308.1 Pyruvate dehydrogenase E1 subunit beta [Candidatus Gromoviella agglomerans]